MARMISYLHDNPTRGDFETWSKQYKITCKQSFNLRTEHGIIHILRNDTNKYGARTQKLTRCSFVKLARWFVSESPVIFSQMRKK